MRLLFVSQFYEPEPADVITHQLAKTLVAMGHQVRVIAPWPNYPFGRVYDAYRGRALIKEVMDGVEVVRVPVYPDHSRSAIKRLCTYGTAALSQSLCGALGGWKPDLVWVYQGPLATAVPGVALSRLLRAPLIIHLEDMWPETALTSNMLRPGRLYGALAKLSGWLYSKATLISVQSDGFRENLLQKKFDHRRIAVIPNWADGQLFHPTVRDEELGQEFGLAGKFNIMYTGNLGILQALHSVIEAAYILRDRGGLQFAFVGAGADEQRLRKLVAERQLTNVRFIPHVPRAKVNSFLAWADGVLIHLKDDPLYGITVPSKSQVYLAAGRPIICAARGDTARLIEAAGAGLTCEPESPESLAAAITKLQHTGVAARQAMADSGRRWFEKHLRRDVLVAKFEELFRSVVSK